MKLIELSKYVEKNSLSNSANMRLNPDDIPFTDFFENIIRIRNGEPEIIDENSMNNNEYVSDENNSYTRTLIDEYIREGVKEYVESLVGANS